VGVQEHEVPEPVATHERAPLRGVRGIDVVMLAETIQRERDGEDEEDRDDAGAGGGIETERVPEDGNDRQVERDREPALGRDRALQLEWVRRRLAPRGAEVNREERRRTGQQVIPALVMSRRKG